jgi:hypothetical protein
MSSNPEIRRIKTWVGATARKLRFQVRNPETLLPIDLGDVENAYLSASIDERATYKFANVVMRIEVGTDGWCYFYPTAAQVDTAGDYYGNIKLEYTDTLDYSKEFIIEVGTPNDSTVS